MSSDWAAWRSACSAGWTPRDCTERYRAARRETNWLGVRCYSESRRVSEAGALGQDPRRVASIFDCDNVSYSPDSSRWSPRSDSESVSGYDECRAWLGPCSRPCAAENLSFVSGPILNIRLRVIACVSLRLTFKVDYKRSQHTTGPILRYRYAPCSIATLGK